MITAYIRPSVVYGTKIFFGEIDALPLDQYVPAMTSDIYLDGIEVQIPSQRFYFMLQTRPLYRYGEITTARGRTFYTGKILFLPHDAPSMIYLLGKDKGGFFLS